MNFSWLLLLSLGIGIFFSSCEKEINIPITAGNPKLVVQGEISNEQQPVVLLTKSIGFFDKIDATNIEFVKDATIWVTDLTNNKKIQLVVDSSLPFTFYTILNSDPLYNDFKVGIEGHTYKLDITYNNEIYSAVSTIPYSVRFDSLYFEPESRFDDTLFALKGVYKDPDTVGNSYKYFTKRSGLVYKDADFLEPFSSRFDDTYFNGQTINLDLFIGFDNSDSVDNQFSDGASYSAKGDTIIVKLSAMDVHVYNFWKTMDFAEGSIGNPFAAPTQVKSNISNGAFGVWSAYANKYDTIINKP